MKENMENKVTYIFRGPKLLEPRKIVEAIGVARQAIGYAVANDITKLSKPCGALKRLMYSREDWLTGATEFKGTDPAKLVNEYVSTWNNGLPESWKVRIDNANSSRLVIIVGAKFHRDEDIEGDYRLLRAGEWLGFGKLFGVNIASLRSSKPKVKIIHTRNYRG